jgi:hypothetical protein
MKNRLPLTREMMISGGLISAIVVALQATMLFTGREVGPLIAFGAALLIALILALVASSGPE